MRINLEMDPQLADRLAPLKAQPARDPEKAAQGRAAFLAQAAGMQAAYSPAVTPVKQPRHAGWQLSFQWKAVGTILIIVLLLLGGGSITVAAAQNSLPDHVLYPIKIWSEDIRVALAARDQTRAALALELAERRGEEIQALLRVGQTPPETVQFRLQAEIDLALQAAINQPEPQASQALRPICEQLQSHVQQFKEIRPPADHSANASLSQIQMLLQDRLRQCNAGMTDPALLPEWDRNREQAPPSVPSQTPSQKASQTSSPQVTRTLTPGNRYGSGPGDGSDEKHPWTTGTLTPGSGFGSGPEGEPGGNHPWVTGTPTPMRGNGSGTGGEPGGPGSGGSPSGPAASPTPASDPGDGGSGEGSGSGGGAGSGGSGGSGGGGGPGGSRP